MYSEYLLNRYKGDNGNYLVKKFIQDVREQKIDSSDVELKHTFAKMLQTNIDKNIFIKNNIALAESSIFALGLSFFKSMEDINSFFDANAKKSSCKICNSQQLEKVTNFCCKDGVRKDENNEYFDKEFMKICRDANYLISYSETGVTYICLKCFLRILTVAYIRKNKCVVEELNTVQNNGCFECNIEEKTKENKMDKFAKVNNVTTATDGQLAIVKDGIAYILDENNAMVPVASCPATDRSYASIRVLITDVKERDVVLDPSNKNPVFVEKTEGNRVTFRDILNATSIVRDFVPDEITGEATVTKLVSVIRLVRGNRTILPVINRYGKDRVFDVMINQFLSYGTVDAGRIEAEINPTMIQLEMTKSMQSMTNAVGNLVEKLGTVATNDPTAETN